MKLYKRTLTFSFFFNKITLVVYKNYIGRLSRVSMRKVTCQMATYIGCVSENAINWEIHFGNGLIKPPKWTLHVHSSGETYYQWHIMGWEQIEFNKKMCGDARKNVLRRILSYRRNIDFLWILNTPSKYVAHINFRFVACLSCSTLDFSSVK